MVIMSLKKHFLIKILKLVFIEEKLGFWNGLSYIVT